MSIFCVMYQHSLKSIYYVYIYSTVVSSLLMEQYLQFVVKYAVFFIYSSLSTVRTISTIHCTYLCLLSIMRAFYSQIYCAPARLVN
jgi:hypothetical protein